MGTGAILVPLFIAMGFLVMTSWITLQWWVWEYIKPDSYYSHGLVMPLIIAVLLWHRRRRLREVPKRVFPPALFLVVISLVVLVVASKHWMQALMSLAFLGTVTGSIWFLGGSALLRATALPLAFLYLMAPLPGPVLNDLTLGVQQSSTRGAALLLQGIGLHPLQQGNVIQMENFTLNVDVPCSGFKLLLRLLTFSGAFAALTDMSNDRRLKLFLFSLPLAIVVNAVRIALIGVVGECMGNSAAMTFHDWSGTICLCMCLAVLFWVAKGLGCRSFAGQRIF
jgi:exosortase